MILSHKYGFIFIKTGKVGGTSFEIALSRFLGPEDIITPVSRTDELVRFRRGYRTAQNFEKRMNQLKPSEWPRWLSAKLGSSIRHGERRVLEQNRMPKLFWDHMSAEAIRERIDLATWDKYYKFIIDRNPWDRIISQYYWDPKKRKQDLSFREFVFSGHPLRSQFDRYTVNGIVSVDQIIRYDRLYHELSELSERLGFPEDIGKTMSSISAKSGYRPTREVDSFFDEYTKEIVEIFYAREIRLLGFYYGDSEN